MTSLVDAVITVGKGRGFLIEHEHQRLVITAAHCLPRRKVPPPHPARYNHECTFPLLAPLSKRRTAIWAEVLFVDPVADIAVLGEPDGQVFFGEHEAFMAFTEARPVFEMGDILPHPRPSLARPETWKRQTHSVQALRLDGQWGTGRASHTGRSLLLDGIRFERGMSGSPIITPDGRAVGVVSTDLISPRLAGDLPAWLAPVARPIHRKGHTS
jgi:hypothetical protein